MGRVRQAYRLNVQEAGVLISALTHQGCIELYELWHEAERFVAIEENNKKSIYDEVDEAYFPDVSDLKQDLLHQRLATKRLLRHFLSLARGGKPIEQLQRIFDRVLHFTYDGPDKQQVDSVNRILDLIYEQVIDYHGKDKVDIGWIYVRPELFEKFCNFFDDAIFANKEAAAVWLSEQGYSWERSVKGLSKEIVERILVTAATVQTQTTPATLLSPSPPTAALIVPRSLWEGKTHRAVREAMRKEEFSDAVIAHILLTRCKVPKTEIASLLNTNTKRIRDFLAEAATIDIVDS